jgi:hypothetical protein
LPPNFDIASMDDRGPTDNSALDNLWVVHLREGKGEPERLLFSVAQSCPASTDAEVAELIVDRAATFANDESALEQFRDCAVPHPPEHPERRAVLLGYR